MYDHNLATIEASDAKAEAPLLIQEWSVDEVLQFHGVKNAIDAIDHIDQLSRAEIEFLSDSDFEFGLAAEAARQASVIWDDGIPWLT